MKRITVEHFLILKNKSIQEGLKQLDETGKRLLFVINEDEQLVGALTDGDIRRYIISHGRIDGTVYDVCNKNPFSISYDYDNSLIKNDMLEKEIDGVPVLSSNGKIIDILFRENVFDKEEEIKLVKKINLPVVIMAGGKGTRLDAFTNVLPKPLIPIGDKTIIEIIIEKFLEFGMLKFHISVNYKAKIIKSYFDELKPDYEVQFIDENKPLGTAGALKYVSEKIHTDFFLSNCDIIIQTDYAELYEFHKKNQNDLTLVASLKNYNIPYGVCNIQNGGTLKDIEEKPQYSFLVNTGLYILKKEVLSYIPEDTFYNMTDLISDLKRQDAKIGVFPISENSWIDTGEWAEYHKALESFGFNKISI